MSSKYAYNKKTISTFDDPINSLPNDKFVDWSKLKAFADDKINVSEKLKFVVGWVEKHCGKRRKCWLPAFYPFPTMFLKDFFFKGR